MGWILGASVLPNPFESLLLLLLLLLLPLRPFFFAARYNEDDNERGVVVVIVVVVEVIAVVDIERVANPSVSVINIIMVVVNTTRQ